MSDHTHDYYELRTHRPTASGWGWFIPAVLAALVLLAIGLSGARDGTPNVEHPGGATLPATDAPQQTVPSPDVAPPISGSQTADPRSTVPAQ